MRADHVPRRRTSAAPRNGYPMTAGVPRRAARAARAAAYALLPLVLTACPWFTTFDRQPSIDPWETASDTIAFRGNPQGSVPITGSGIPGFVVSYSALPGTIDSMSAFANPAAPTAASLENGRKYYSINCAVCHGDTGDGAGTATKFGMPQISLLTATTQGRTDGYVYGMIRNGRGLMPTYNRIEEHDRWDVVNYVRGLQGRLPSPVATGALGKPGETGATLPGFTATAPTRPAPYYREHLKALPAAAAADTHGPGAPGSPAGAPGTVPVGVRDTSDAQGGHTP